MKYTQPYQPDKNGYFDLSSMRLHRDDIEVPLKRKLTDEEMSLLTEKLEGALMQYWADDLNTLVEDMFPELLKEETEEVEE